jgi:hypothetical protein
LSVSVTVLGDAPPAAAWSRIPPRSPIEVEPEPGHFFCESRIRLWSGLRFQYGQKLQHANPLESC